MWVHICLIVYVHFGPHLEGSSVSVITCSSERIHGGDSVVIPILEFADVAGIFMLAACPVVLQISGVQGWPSFLEEVLHSLAVRS